MYDESDCPYFYETRRFSETDPPPAEPWTGRVLGKFIADKYDNLRSYATDEDVREIMFAEDFSCETIDTFLSTFKSKTKQTVSIAAFQRTAKSAEDRWILQRLALIPPKAVIPTVVVSPPIVAQLSTTDQPSDIAGNV